MRREQQIAAAVAIIQRIERDRIADEVAALATGYAPDRPYRERLTRVATLLREGKPLTAELRDVSA